MTFNLLAKHCLPGHAAARMLRGAGTLAGLLAMAGCASYHPLPLATHAQLVRRIADVRHTLPAAPSRKKPLAIDVGKPLGIDEIGLLAILNDPGLRTERGEFDLAQAELTQSATLPNPSVSLGYAALLGGPGSTGAYAASLSEDIVSLVTYRRRKSAARAHVFQVNADLLWQEWQVAQKARLLAVDLYWGERLIASSKAALAALSQTASTVRSAVAAGSLSVAALAPLSASQASAEHSLAALRLQQLRNWRNLDALLGMTPDARFAMTEPHAPRMPADLHALIASVAARRPDLIALQLGYRSADETLRAAIIRQFPAFVLGGSWTSDTSDVRSAGPTATFDLPIFDRNQGQVANARATRRLLNEQYQNRLDDAVSSILALQVRSHRIAAELAQAQQHAASSRSRADAARQAYIRNNIDQRALMDFETTALQRRLDVFDLERGRDEARIALALELGLGLPRTRMAPHYPVRQQ